jgi:hyaluronan synthase
MPILDTWLSEKFLGRPITWGDDRALTNWVIKRGYRTMYTDGVQAYTIVPEHLRQFIKQQVRWKKGWLVNSLFASRFIIWREPFVAFTYFFPLMLVTFLTPFMAARAFIYTPIMKGGSSILYYAIGVFLMTTLILLVYRFIERNNKYWPYLFVWATINMFVLSYLLVYAVATIQDRGWGTRGVAKPARST